MFCIVTTSFSGSLFAALQHAPMAGSMLSGTPCIHYFSFMLRSTTMCPPLSSSLPLLLLHSQLVYTNLQQVYVSWSWLGLDQIPSLLFSESTTGSMSYTSDASIFSYVSAGTIPVAGMIAGLMWTDFSLHNQHIHVTLLLVSCLKTVCFAELLYPLTVPTSSILSHNELSSLYGTGMFSV
jgi:hypothetical protein